MKKQNVAGVVEELISPLISELGYRLWDVEFRKVGADPTLTITIDKDDGITIEDCEKFHRAIDPILDEADPISEAYILEVSSPGIERELKTAEHIEACEGWDVEVRLYAPRNGAKMFRGVLCGYDENGDIAVEIGGEKVTFKPEEIAKVFTYFDFGNS